MKLGILRETKSPPDKRVPFTPKQCRELLNRYEKLELYIQPSDYRCYSDQEYQDENITLREDLSDCEVLMGVKEVDIPKLIPGKTYLFFSHTAKEQPYNRGLLQALAKNGITILDYEYLTKQDKTRVVAFGRWAGIVGAYNGLKAFGDRTGNHALEPAWSLRGLEEMKEKLKSIELGSARIALTGGGRVALGSVEILQAAGIREVSPAEYLSGRFEEAIFCRLDPWHYTRHSHGQEFKFEHFVENPQEYENTFHPYAQSTDLYIAGHFWDPNSPVLLSQDDLQYPDHPIKVIADISCDINGPIASTVRASSIAEPVYGYNPSTGKEVLDPNAEDSITVMAVDNLPGELPRDASEDFGKALMKNVLPYLIGSDDEGIVKRAMILEGGELTELYGYLKEYLGSKK
jgi:saccharopine dehydrogenase (NAD+, L-lysine-forming)